MDEFYRMQIQQHESLYHRGVTEDEAVAALSAGYSMPCDSAQSTGSQHHRQQSIEMTQFETAGPGARGSNAGVIVESYKKPQKHHHHRNAVRAAADDDDYDAEDDVGDSRIKSMPSAGTMGRRRRVGSQQVLGGVASASGGGFTGNGGSHSYHHHQQQQQQHGLTTRRRNNAECLSNLQPAAGASSNTPSNYNTAGGGSVGYYAAEVYATMESRQQQAKQQQKQQQLQQRSYSGGGCGDDDIVPADMVAGENSLAAKRSWRRQQNRRRRVGGVLGTEPGCEADAVRPASDYGAAVMDTVVGGGRTVMIAEDPTALLDKGGRYRGANITTTQMEHHHRSWQNNSDAHVCIATGNHPLAGGPSSAGPSADQHATNGAGVNSGSNGANKNVVKFHDVGREIDV